MGEAEDSVAITVPRSEVSGFVNNKKEVYTFRSAPSPLPFSVYCLVQLFVLSNKQSKSMETQWLLLLLSCPHPCRFNRVFNQDSKQDEVFEVVSRGVIDK